MSTNQNAETKPAPDSREVLLAAGAEYGLDVVEEVGEDLLDPTLVAQLPVEWARAHAMLPIRWKGRLGLLLSDPADLGKQKEVSLVLGQEFTPVLAARAAILKGIERCYFSQQNTAEEFLEDMGAGASDTPPVARKSDDLLRVAEEAPITQLVNLILLEAVKARASDIHFEPFESRLRLRYRVDGILYERPAPPKHLELALISRLKVMAHMDIAEKRLPQDGMARVRGGEREIDIRASTMPVAEGERVVLRLLDRDSSLLPLSDLGMPEDMTVEFGAILQQANGLVLVTGPTGSGKTTTLYAALRQLDTSGRNVMTIEEPVEYQLPDIGQIQVKPKIGLTFARGLRHILRQDPDVILVGETRDVETAEIAVRASLTGHLVFTTLHTNDAPNAAIRMLDMGVESYLLAAALRAVLAQRLVRKLCPKCRMAVRSEPRGLVGLGEAGRRLAGQTVWRPVGCGECLGGYRGRLGLFELMTISPEIEETIRTGRGSANALRRVLTDRGVPGLVDDGVRKILAGETSVEEVLHAMGQAS